MLYVILLILKIIGIILAAILGLIILLICIVLFTPIRYKLTSNATGNIKDAQALFKVSWLFHLVTARISYQEKVLKWQARIAWIKLGNQEKHQENQKRKPGKGARKKIFKRKMPSKNYVDETQAESKTSVIGEKQVKSEALLGKETQTKREKAEISDKRTPPQEQKRETNAATQSSKKKPKSKFKQKFQDIFHKIKYTIKNIYDKIKMINGKKKEVLEFLRVDVHKQALQKLKVEGLKLLKKLMPKKFVADVAVGFDDPSATGYFLAGYSIVFPFLPKRVSIRPDFERAIFDGKAMLKGYVRIVWIVAFVWNMAWNKDVRKTYYDVREFEFKEGI